MNIPLKDQVVVVTGAGGAVGSALVAHLQEHARHVVGTLRGSGVDWQLESEQLSFITGDLTDPVRVNLMVTEILRRLNDLHAWINVAGGFSLDGPVEAVPATAWPFAIRDPAPLPQPVLCLLSGTASTASAICLRRPPSPVVVSKGVLSPAWSWRALDATKPGWYGSSTGW